MEMSSVSEYYVIMICNIDREFVAEPSVVVITMYTTTTLLPFLLVGGLLSRQLPSAGRFSVAQRALKTRHVAVVSNWQKWCWWSGFCDIFVDRPCGRPSVTDVFVIVC